MNRTVYNKLIEVAKNKVLINYQKLSDECNLGLDMNDAIQRNELANIIGEISKYEVKKKRPLLIYREK